MDETPNTAAPAKGQQDRCNSGCGRGDNEAMSKSFQFSIISLLGVVALAGLTARVVAALIPIWNPSLIVAFFGSFVFCGAIVGSAAGRPIRGMLAGIFLATMLVIGVAVLDHFMMGIRE
jgi:hypothetical protein